MKQYCYVIMNNAGHSWPALSNGELVAGADPSAPILPRLLQEGWEPIRETPMGGGTSQLAHSLILLEKAALKPKPAAAAKTKK
jgi:hypothetical protein